MFETYRRHQNLSFCWFTVHNCITITATMNVKINLSEFEVIVNKVYITVVHLMPRIELEVECHLRGRHINKADRFINLHWSLLRDKSDSVFGLSSKLLQCHDTVNKVSLNNTVNLLCFDIRVELFLCLNSHINNGWTSALFPWLQSAVSCTMCEFLCDVVPRGWQKAYNWQLTNYSDSKLTVKDDSYCKFHRFTVHFDS
jgi:hypothetical protein